MAERVTEKQQAILDFIISFTQDNGFQPSFREIGTHFGIKSTRAVSDHIEALRRKGILDKDPPGRARSVTITKMAHLSQKPDLKKSILTTLAESVKKLFLMEDYVPAGSIGAVLDDAKRESYFFDHNLVAGGERTFLIKARGDSMINAHIQDGDMVLVDPDYPHPTNGDIIVARLNSDATVKRFYRESTNLIRLQPENETMKPIFVKPNDGEFFIVGKVVGVFRRM